MPELPEVESVRRALREELTGRGIVAVRTSRLALRRPLREASLRRRLTGGRFRSFRRRGKYLLADVGEDLSLLVHLGMSGRLLVARPEVEPPPHTHVVLDLDDGRQLRYVDPRRFGFLQVLTAREEATDPSLKILGLEPLDDEVVGRLPQLLDGRRAPIKAMLLDQRVLAGVGNIYADEALWRAGVRPDRPAGTLSGRRCRRLAEAVREVLEEAISQGGTTIRDYARPDGWPGGFAVRLAAYGRGGEPCVRCGGKLREGRIAGRGTTWCGRCQR